MASFNNQILTILAGDVLPPLDENETGENVLIYNAIRHLSQQVADSKVALTKLINDEFSKQQKAQQEAWQLQQEAIRQIKERLNDFLTSNFTITLTPASSGPPPGPSTPSSSSRRPRSPSTAGSLRSSASPPRRRMRTAGPNAEAPVILPLAPRYLLNRGLKTVVDVWREWSVGIGNGPAVKKLNDSYGSGWRTGWPQKERQYYSMRMIIINNIYHLAINGAQGLEPRYEEVAERMDRERGGNSLNQLAHQIRARR